MSNFEKVIVFAIVVAPLLLPFVVWFSVKLGTAAYLLTKRRFDQNFRKGPNDY